MINSKEWKLRILLACWQLHRNCWHIPSLSRSRIHERTIFSLRFLSIILIIRKLADNFLLYIRKFGRHRVAERFLLYEEIRLVITGKSSSSSDFENGLLLNFLFFLTMRGAYTKWSLCTIISFSKKTSKSMYSTLLWKYGQLNQRCQV